MEILRYGVIDPPDSEKAWERVFDSRLRHGVVVLVLRAAGVAVPGASEELHQDFSLSFRVSTTYHHNGGDIEVHGNTLTCPPSTVALHISGDNQEQASLVI